MVGEYSITIKKEPRNPTKFKRGDILTYEGSDARLLVVGEDDLYLHTFMPTGDYYGVVKEAPNLECLVVEENQGSR